MEKVKSRLTAVN